MADQVEQVLLRCAPGATPATPPCNVGTGCASATSTCLAHTITPTGRPLARPIAPCESTSWTAIHLRHHVGGRLAERHAANALWSERRAPWLRLTKGKRCVSSDVEPITERMFGYAANGPRSPRPVRDATRRGGLRPGETRHTRTGSDHRLTTPTTRPMTVGEVTGWRFAHRSSCEASDRQRLGRPTRILVSGHDAAQRPRPRRTRAGINPALTRGLRSTIAGTTEARGRHEGTTSRYGAHGPGDASCRAALPD